MGSEFENHSRRFARNQKAMNPQSPNDTPPVPKMVPHCVPVRFVAVHRVDILIIDNRSSIRKDLAKVRMRDNFPLFKDGPRKL